MNTLHQLDRLPPESRRLGPFLLRKKLGQGGFAPVYLADEVYEGVTLRQAAVKVFSLGLARAAGPSSSGRASAPPSADAARRRREILEEARALCQVEHPHIVRFYRVHADEELGAVGLAMEYLSGQSIAFQLGGGPLSIDDTLVVGEAVASALAATHRAGLVHRDVKPANVLRANGTVKLIDFGIASAASARKRRDEPPKPLVIDGIPIDATGTLASVLLGQGGDDQGAAMAGTIGYMDPHSMQTSEPATFESDLYSLGATLFECLTGVVPSVGSARLEHKGGRDEAVLFGRASAPSVSALRPDVPASLAELVAKLLAPTRALRPRSADVVAAQLARIKRERRGRTGALPPEEVGPFRGLGRFEADDRDVFFGRTAEISGAVELLRRHGLVALLGPSGSGKSSLARAGVVPAVREGALELPAAWESVLVTPGHDPWGTWSAALTAMSTRLGREHPSEVAEALAKRAEDSGRGFLLVVDQLEELATLSEPASRQRAVALLEELALRPRPGVRVLVAGRRDLLDPLIALSTSFGTALARGALFVGPIDDAAWGDIVDEALAAYGVRFDAPTTRAELLEQLRGKGSAMPLAQFALTELWSRRDRAAKTISRAALVEMGGVDGALQRHAEKTAEALLAVAPEAALRSVLLALCTAKGTRALRSAAELERAGGGPFANAIVSALLEARLLVQEPEGTTLAHEALVTQWPRLASWLADAAIDRRVAEDLEHAVTAWRRDPADLWKSARLAVGEQVVARALVPLPDGAREFVAASRAAERRGRLVAGIFVGLAFAVVVGIAVFFANERKLADNLRAQAEAEKALAAAEREQARRDAKEASDRLALAEKEGEAARTASARAIADKGAAEQARKDFFEAVKTVYSRAELEALKRKYGMQVNPPPAAGPKGQLVDATPW